MAKKISKSGMKSIPKGGRITEGDEPTMDNKAMPLVRTSEFHKIYVTRALPFITDFDIRIVTANETMQTDEGWCTIVDGMLILTPVAAKELADDLRSAVLSWEELQGKIKGRNKQRILAEFKREEG